MCRAVVTLTPHSHPTLCPGRDSMDSVKQSAALCLLRLYKASPDLVPMGEWTARVVHLLNDQHMVRPLPGAQRPWTTAPKTHRPWQPADAWGPPPLPCFPPGCLGTPPLP